MAPYLDPVNQAFVDAGAKAGGPPLYELSYVDTRAALECIQAHEPASDVVAVEFDVETPANPSGSPNTHDRLLRDLVIVFPYYTPATDAQYPVQYEQGYAVVLHIAPHGASLGLKTEKFATAGDTE